MTATLTERAKPLAADDDDLTHVGCCLGNYVALCGSITDGDTDEDANCAVCLDLEDLDDFCPVRSACIQADGP